MDSDADLQKFRLESLPSEVYYLPDFINKELEKSLLDNIDNVPLTRWTNLSHRRLQNWGGTPHIKGMLEESMPRWLTEICTKVSRLGIFGGRSANHVLINEYLPGQGIMPHTDGPLYYPAVAIVSLSGGCLLDFIRPYKDSVDENTFTKLDGKRLGSVYLRSKSLIIFKDSAYTECLHGINETPVDILDEKVANLDVVGLCPGIEVPRIDPRVSMTIRVVLKTVKASKIFGRTK